MQEVDGYGTASTLLPTHSQHALTHTHTALTHSTDDTHNEWSWKRYAVTGWERPGAGGMQHSGSGAALGRARDAGRGLPAPTPSPAFDINNTNSSSPGPRGQAKGPQ